MVPETGAAGVGQLVTVQGFGLALTENPVASFQPALGGATIQCSFNFPGVSTDNELYLRLTASGCTLPVGSYLLSIKTNQGIASPYSFDVKLNPATPIVRFIGNIQGSPITAARTGDTIVVYGYGIDAVNAKVVLGQGANTQTVSAGGIGGPLGMGAKIVIPAGFTPGTLLVQLQAHVGPSGSSPSNALKLTLVP